MALAAFPRSQLHLGTKMVAKLSLAVMRSQVQLGNEKKRVAAGFSLRPHRRDACATKDFT